MKKLPKECFEYQSVHENNYKLFIVDNAVVLPENIKAIEYGAFYGAPE